MPRQTIPAHITPDGLEVSELLSTSGAYSDHVHDDDLNPTSMAYSSYRHKVDQQQSLAEYQHQQILQHQLENLLAADDIVAYLMDTRYTDDIYGLLPEFDALVREARQEVQNTDSSSPRRAVERLRMIQQHMLSCADNSPSRAAAISWDNDSLNIMRDSL